MAGITNTAFRRLCREYGAGLYVCEMITIRALVERNPRAMRLITHHERRRRAASSSTASTRRPSRKPCTMLVAEDRADHIDLNFGCPVPKVTRKGGGAALPWKLGLFREIVERAAGQPATPADREDAQGHRRRPPHLPRGRPRRRGRGGRRRRSARAHGRRFYSGTADWSAIASSRRS